MKRGMICWCFSCGELGTAVVHLQLSIPRWDAPPPASPSLEDLNLRFWPPNTGQKPTIQRDIIPLCPEKPFLSPKIKLTQQSPPGTTLQPSQAQAGFSMAEHQPLFPPHPLSPLQHIFLAPRHCLNLLSLHADFK